MIKTSERLPDALLESFRLVRRLPHSGTACVYEAIATRGRLRDRSVAVKKVLTTQRRESLTAIHQSLSHPGIVALYSVVPLLDVEYHILELCTAGNLTDILESRNPPILSDRELRQLVKDLAAALAYLKQENIIHRNICRSNTLIAKGFQVKICDFEHAIQVGSMESTAKFVHATYPSPETLRPPYLCDFPMDMWAFGCLVISCLQKCLPTTNAVPLDPESWRILSGYSRNFQDFVVSFLATNPGERLSADDIMQHPVLHESFTGDNSSSSKTSSRLACHSSYGFSGSRLATSTSPGSSTVHDQRRPEGVLKNVTNTKLRDYILEQSKDAAPHRAIMRQPPVNSQGFITQKPKRDKVEPGEAQPTISTGGTTSTPCQPDTIPIGTMRPATFDTNLLKAATHKLAGGSITVLPSFSVLVDFRESQRRHGFKGDHVLLIDSAGQTIHVYSAPHLSIPSCLLEPMETFGIEDLPAAYWKQYNDASSFINTIKRKTPQMTVHKSGVRYVLMSNLPQPDVEMVLHSSYYSNTKKSEKSTPIMRIRYSRQNCSLELSERLIREKSPGWNKECIPCGDLDIYITTNNFRLSDTCREGLRLLTEFLRTCDGLTEHATQHTSSPPNPPARLFPDSPEHFDVPMSLSSIKIPDKPIKYSLKASTSRNKENQQAPPSTHSPARQAKPSQRSAMTIEAILPDTRHLPGIGWCVRKLVVPTSPKMKYQLMFDDGVCLEVNFCSGILTLVNGQAEPVKCLISAKSSYPEIEKRLIHLKDFMLLYDQSDTTFF